MRTATRLVIVDDEVDLRALLVDFLGARGHAVEAVGDGPALRALVERGPADLYVLDVGLPGEDGLQLARFLRERLDPGIVMLTAAGTLVDRVVGLEVGADDYVTKPFALEELASRIEAVLRRRSAAVSGPPEGMLPFGPYLFDSRAFSVRRAEGTDVELAPMEVDLVAAFATNAGKVLDRDTLLRLAPPRGESSLGRAIDHRITRLRRKLEADPDHPQLIKTVRGRGYVFPG